MTQGKNRIDQKKRYEIYKKMDEERDSLDAMTTNEIALKVNEWFGFLFSNAHTGKVCRDLGILYKRKTSSPTHNRTTIILCQELCNLYHELGVAIPDRLKSVLDGMEKK